MLCLLRLLVTSLPVNLQAPSVTRYLGTPYSLIMAWLMKQLTVVAKWSFVALQTGQRVAKSITTNMKHCPRALLGKGPITSSPQTLKGSGSATALMVGSGPFCAGVFFADQAFI